MEDNALPQAIGESLLPPAQLTLKQEELCKKLDDLHAQNDLKTRASDMFRGAIFALRSECRSNPDWIAQAANSLREILYPLWNGGMPGKKMVLEKYGSVRTDAGSIQEVGAILGSFTELAHHGNGRGASIDFTTFIAKDFEDLLADFERVMLNSLTRQVDIHQEIDDLLSTGPSSDQVEDSGIPKPTL